MPLKVAATSVKFAIPPPISRALLRPSGSAVAYYERERETETETESSAIILSISIVLSS